MAQKECALSNQAWRVYSSPQRAFTIQYPSFTKPEEAIATDPRLTSKTIFQFEQPFRSGPDAGSLRFSLQVSVWSNPSRISADAWVRQRINPDLILQATWQPIAGMMAYRTLQTNLMAHLYAIYLSHGHTTLEITYTDLTTDDVLIDSKARACWTALFERMVSSLAIP